MSIDGTITVEGSAVQDAQVQIYDRMRQIQDGSARTDSSGSYSISLSNNAGPYLIGVDYYDKSSDTYFGDEKTIMRNFADGLETGEYQRWWTINYGNFNIKTNHSYNGSYSAGIEDGSADKDVAEIAFSDWSGGTTDVRQVEFIWYELGSQHGGGLRVINSNGNEEVGLATDNPQWDTHDASGYTEQYGGDDYQHWTLFRLENFDWTNNTVDFYMEDLSTGSTASGSLSLINGVDMEKLYITNYAGGWASNDAFYMWFDNITVLYIVWYSPYSYKREIQNVSLTDGLIVPLIDKDPDGDGSNSTYYAQDGYIYYNDDGDFGFGTDSGQKYGFSTFVDGVANQQSVGTPPSGLISYWTLDNDNAWDPISGNNGTLKGGVTTGATGQVKNCYDFDETDDYITISNDPTLNFGNGDAFTITLWINIPTGSVPDTGGMIDKGVVYNRWTDQIGFQIWLNNDGSGNVEIGGGTKDTGGSTNWCGSGGDYDDGNWYFVTLVRYSDGTTELFIDCGSVDSNSTSTGDLTTSDDLFIGQNGKGEKYFGGKIDEIRIYDRALSKSKSQTLFDHTKPTTGNDPTFGSEQTI